MFSPHGSTPNTPTRSLSRNNSNVSLNSAAAAAFASAAMASSHIIQPISRHRGGIGNDESRPESLRMVATFLRTQLFQGFMERIDTDRAMFFHDVLDLLEAKGVMGVGSAGGGKQSLQTVVQSADCILQKQEKENYHVFEVENRGESAQSVSSCFEREYGVRIAKFDELDQHASASRLP